MCKALWISGFIALAAASFSTGFISDHHAIPCTVQPKLYEIKVAQNSPQKSYENTKNYISKDGKTSTRITQGESQGIKYQIIETQSSGASAVKAIDQNIQQQVQLANKQRDLMVADMNNQINSTLSKINKLNQSLEPVLEPGIVISKS